MARSIINYFCLKIMLNFVLLTMTNKKIKRIIRIKKWREVLFKVLTSSEIWKLRKWLINGKGSLNKLAAWLKWTFLNVILLQKHWNNNLIITQHQKRFFRKHSQSKQWLHLLKFVSFLLLVILKMKILNKLIL